MRVRSLWHWLRSRLVSPEVDSSLTDCRSHRSPDHTDLPKQIEEAVGQVLCSTGIGARVLDRDHLLLIARRLNERSAREKGLGQLILAEALCQRALEVLETTVSPDHPEWLEVLDNGASILHQRAALLEARAAVIRAGKADEKFFGSRSREADSRIEKRGEWGGVY